ncbi:MAG: 16S rRNA (uracil(1498)-N(3))-methyltransferase [Mariprofundaceae bacterium]|nr:16S rRNA (uracil(1498)-N(3))-methyltransferase [Mariprofundaceae bacterium]
MSRHRLFVLQDLKKNQQVILDSEQAHYLRTVMRLSVGDCITLFNGDGAEYEAELHRLHKAEAGCTVKSCLEVETELSVGVHLIQCSNRSDRIETMLQKTTELGVASIQVSNSERSALKLNTNKLEQRMDRWQKIVVEASEQSQRVLVPEVCWRSRLNQVDIQGKGFILHPEAGVEQWAQFQACVVAGETVTLCIGPEGGWSLSDIAILEDLSCERLAFGARIMRTETAGPALMAAVQAIILSCG